MADQDLDINIRTVADLTGVKKASDAIALLDEQAKKSQAAAGAGAGEADVLAKAIGSVIGRVAGGIAGGIGIGLVADQIRQYTADLNKATEEIMKQSERVAELGRSWEEAAKMVLTTGDLRKVAASGMEEFERIHNQIRAIATEDMPMLEKAGDTVVKGLKNAFTFGGDPGAKGPYEKINEERIKALALDEAQLRKEKIHAIELGETYQDMFEELKQEPIDDAMTRIGEKITGLELEQQSLNKLSQDYLEKYNEINQELALAERTQELLLATEKERKREAEETKRSKQEDVDFWGKQLKGASPQVKAILMQEEAARKAREEGREKDAEMFERSAEAFKRGLTPGQRAELGPLENNAGVIKAIEENTAATNRLADLWK